MVNWLHIFFWFVVVVVHELGHYIGYLIGGVKKPVFKLKWWGIQAGNQVQAGSLKVRFLIINALLGIMMGIIPFFIIDTPDNWLLYYIILSIMDINLIIGLYGLVFKGMIDVPAAKAIFLTNINDYVDYCKYVKGGKR